MRLLHHFKTSLAVICLGIFLASVTPSPAYAQLDALNAVLQNLFGAIAKLFQAFTDGFSKAISANAAGQQVMTRTMTQTADHVAQENREGVRQGVLATIQQNNQDPHDYACAVATDGKDDEARAIKEEEIMRRIEAILSHLFRNPNAANEIGKKNILRVLCQLGATGLKEGCTVQAPVMEGNAPAREDVEGGDISMATAILNNICIPFDPTKLKTELDNSLANNNWTLGDVNLRKAMVAFMALRLRNNVDQPPFPDAEQMKPLTGVDDAISMTGAASGFLASNRSILQAFAYHACLSKTLLPNCDNDNKGSRQYLLERFTPQDIRMPPDGYCISRWQRDIAMNIRDRKMQARIGQLGGTQLDQSRFEAELEDNITARLDRHRRAMADAALAASAKPSQIRSPKGSRPVQGPVADNNTKELVDSIRALTRALKNNEAGLPHTLEVRVEPQAPPSPPAEIHPSSAAALPPLRQDFPTVQ